ncbi:hypothetical protein [Saccharicrinis sp. 156]|uniref:hypothetical protein n=1 Tax=Saccharicrinis sp. 156 TaxID=3417574 RepID=UPI003D33E419
MITKENYEIWMMDYLDGNLSDSHKALLLQFLEKNPQIKEELQGLDKIILSPDEEVHAPKANLLKAPEAYADMAYPDYIGAKEIEVGLDEDEKTWKASYLQEYDNRLFLLYPKTILKADQTIQYQPKGNIKRAVLIPTLKLNTLRKVSAAAIITFLLSFGAMPFLKKSSDDIQTVAVNDPPSLITMPKTNTQTTTPKKNVKTKKEETEPYHVVEYSTEAVTNTADQSVPEKVEYESLPKREVYPLKTEKVNAYELGLNAMMPIVIANNLLEREQNYLAMQSEVKEESQRLSRSAKAIASGVKVINFLSGNETKMKKVLNQDGVMVAYEVESDNISIRQRIKNKPVTN